MTATGPPMRTPSSPAHRRQLMVDAIAVLDMAAMHDLVTKRAATVDDVQVAIAQVEREHDEVMDAYATWLNEQAVQVVARAANKVRLWIASQPLLPLDAS